MPAYGDMLKLGANPIGKVWNFINLPKLQGTALTATAAEINTACDGITATAAEINALADVSGLSTGTAATGTTASEAGTDGAHITTLTVSTTLPAIAGGADLAVGKLLYTLPAGVQIIYGAYMSMAITQSQGNITADTPDGGLGTTIASGVVNVLGGTAAFENILTGQTFDDCNGTAEVAAVQTSLVVLAGGDKTIYFNVADGWAASGDAAAGLAGTVVLHWATLV